MSQENNNNQIHNLETQTPDLEKVSEVLEEVEDIKVEEKPEYVTKADFEALVEKLTKKDEPVKKKDEAVDFNQVKEQLKREMKQEMLVEGLDEDQKAFFTSTNVDPASLDLKSLELILKAMKTKQKKAPAKEKSFNTKQTSQGRLSMNIQDRVQRLAALRKKQEGK